MMELLTPVFFVGLTMVTLALLSLSLQRKHLLNALLSLEMMVLGLYILILSLSGENSNESFLALVLISMGACEASIGLAMLVMLIRTHGNDYVSSLAKHKC